MKFISGLANCHIPGLYSLVISERTSIQEGMQRVFYAGPDCNMELFEEEWHVDFRVKPHNHRQDLRLTHLFGTVQNVILTPSSTYGMALWKYKFSSALLEGRFKAKPICREYYSLHEHDLKETGPTYMPWQTVHTVVARPHSAWLVEELELAAPGQERCFSTRDNLFLSNAGLYQLLTPAELEHVSGIVNTALTLDENAIAC